MRQNQRKSHESMSVWITWLAVFHHYGHQYLINQCSWCLLGIYRRKDSDHGTSQCISIFGLASATKRGGLYNRAICLIILGIKAFMTFGAYPCKPAAKNQLTWSMFWCFRRVVNKVSPCQMTCFLLNSGRLSIQSSRNKSVNMMNLLVIQECSK